MSTTHDQAMHYIYQQVLQRLLEHMNQAQRASVQLLVQRMLVMGGGAENIGGFRILVLHGPDPRSTHLLACLRAAQLSIALRHAGTFRLQVLVARLPSLDRETVALHERCFSALFLQDDPRVELLRTDAGQLGPFGPRPVCSPSQAQAAGNAWLLFGHLTGGQPDAMLGARGYMELAASLAQALGGEDGANLLVSAIPPLRLHRLLAWGRRCLRHTEHVAQSVSGDSVISLVDGMKQLGDVLSDPLCPPSSRPMIETGRVVRVASVEALLPHPGEAGPLERMLGHATDPCVQPLGPAGLFDPLPLAHLHGLRAQVIEQSSYREGAQALFKRLGHRPLAWPQGQVLRDEAQARLGDAYAIGEKQLACLLSTPFVAQGRNLDAFVLRCQPNMRVALPYLHRALQGRPCPDPVSQWLVDTSGLTLAQLRAIYAGQLRPEVQRLYALLARRDLGLCRVADPASADAAVRQTAM
jgi:hypothetical protein